MYDNIQECPGNRSGMRVSASRIVRVLYKIYWNSNKTGSHEYDYRMAWMYDYIQECPGNRSGMRVSASRIVRIKT